MDKVFQTMMQLIKSEVFGTSLSFSASENHYVPEGRSASKDGSTSEDNSVSERFSEDFLERLFTLSDSHDMAHIVGSALQRNGLLPHSPVGERFKKQVFMSVYRYENIKYELSRIYSILENAHIPYIPLKGSVLRDYYPEPWMRTSCDIDILVQENDIDNAVTALEAVGFENRGKAYHDYSLFSPSNVHLELHFNIKEAMDNIDKLLIRAWDYATPSENSEYLYHFTNEFLMFHQIAHASYHFIKGGCGVKPIIDIFLLKEKLPFNEQELNEMLEMCGISVFYEKLKLLADFWFGDGEESEFLTELEKYILSGGVYGSSENSIAVNQNRHGGKYKAIFRRIFLPHKTLKNLYPVIEKHRWLTPFFQIARWFRVLKNGRLGHGLTEIKRNADMTEANVSFADKILSELGLKDCI